MKTSSTNLRDTQGSVLVITLSVVAVAAIVLASYLIIVQAQTASVARSQSWNQLIAVSESGQEEGYALINKGMPNILGAGHQWDWTNGATSDGWTLSGSVYTMTRTLYGSNSYTVSVDISNGQNPVVTATATVPYTPLPWVFSAAGGPFMAAGGVTVGNGSTNSGATIGRRIQTQAALNSLFTAAIITKSNFNMNGKNCRIDSFDSSNPLYNTGGQYDPTKFKANGILATDSSIVGDVNVGNGMIYGKVYTGPGTSASAVQIGPNGSVGNAAWVGAGTSGIQSGAWSGDFNMNLPDVTAPSYVGLVVPPAIGKVITLPGGNYTAATDPGPSDLNYYLVTGNTTLWVQSSFQPHGIILTNGASLTIFVGNTTGSGATLDLSGNNGMNYPNDSSAQNLSFYGLPSCTSISFNGNAGFVGTIYAPDADMSGGGGGANTLDTSGAMIVKSATFTGHWNFHYDEHLTNAGPSRGWIVKNWTEKRWP